MALVCGTMAGFNGSFQRTGSHHGPFDDMSELDIHCFGECSQHSEGRRCFVCLPTNRMLYRSLPPNGGYHHYATFLLAHGTRRKISRSHGLELKLAALKLFRDAYREQNILVWDATLRSRCVYFECWEWCCVAIKSNNEEENVNPQHNSLSLFLNHFSKSWTKLHRKPQSLVCDLPNSMS